MTGNEQHLAALLDSGASDAFRGREIGLLRAMRERGGAAPLRTFLRRANVLGPTDESYQAVEVTEQDDQGRTRRVRYFLNLACCTRLTEPRTDQLEQWAGPVRRRAGEGYSIAYRDIDADQAAAADAYAKAALALLVAQLGDAYRPTRPITITLAPATIAELPAQASGYTNGTQITLLSSVSEVVASGPGSDWARTVVVHEIAHVLLFARGDAPWGLAEGIPLWLTDDRRRPELDRIVKANAVWDLAHLLEGPRTDAEFYAGYAQASSFVRFLADRYGAQAVLALWEARPTSRTLDQAFRNALGVASAEAYAAWRATLRPPAAWRPSLRPPAASRPSLRPSAACAAFAPTA